MRRIMTMVTPATSTALLTAVQLRTAAGLATSDTSKDAALSAIGDQVSMLIAKACRVTEADGYEPTLCSEKVTDTFRLEIDDNDQWPEYLYLSRKPATAVTSVTELGTALTSSYYSLESRVSRISRVDSIGYPISWANPYYAYGSVPTIVITYTAGFTSVPNDLVRYASDMVSRTYSRTLRDTDISRRRTDIPDVGMSDVTYATGTAANIAVPEDMMLNLVQAGYVNFLRG